MDSMESRYRFLWRSSVALAGVVASAALLACGAIDSRAGSNTSGEPCQREPVGSVTVFFEGGEPSRTLTARVESIAELPELPGYRYVLRESGSGQQLVLKYLAGESMPGVQEGEIYEIRVDYSGGTPDSSGIIVRRQDTLIFAALTDQRLFLHALKDGIEGFQLEVKSSDCASRGSTRCFDSMTNLPLWVSHGGESAELFHGQSATLGAYIVRPLTVQEVRYNARCADAALPAVSLVIERKE